MKTFNGKRHGISTILSLNRRNNSYEKFIAKADPSSKTATSLLNELENFSSQGRIKPITLVDIVLHYGWKHNSTTSSECLIQNFLISDNGEIDSFIVKLMQEEYIDIEATSLR